MKALEDFDPESSHELSLQKDDIVLVVHTANPVCTASIIDTIVVNQYPDILYSSNTFCVN